MATATNTKADLEARIAELESQLNASNGDPRANDQVVLTGFLKTVKPLESSNPNAKFQVTAILTNSIRESVNGEEKRVNLPIDGIIASDNGNGPLASQLLELSQSTRWARVRVAGFWVRRGEVQLRNGYLGAEAKQLRVQAITVLSAQELDEAHAPQQPFSTEPTSEEVPF